MAALSLGVYYHLPNNGPTYELTGPGSSPDPGSETSRRATLLAASRDSTIIRIPANESSRAPGTGQVLGSTTENSQIVPWNPSKTPADIPEIARALALAPNEDTDPNQTPELALARLPGEGNLIDPSLLPPFLEGPVTFLNGIIICFCDSVVGLPFKVAGMIDSALHDFIFDGLLGGRLVVIARIDSVLHDIFFPCDGDDDDDDDDDDFDGDDDDDFDGDDDDDFDGDDDDDFDGDDDDDFDGDDASDSDSDDDFYGDDSTDALAGDDDDDDDLAGDDDESTTAVFTGGNSAEDSMKDGNLFVPGGDTTDDGDTIDDGNADSVTDVGATADAGTTAGGTTPDLGTTAGGTTADAGTTANGATDGGGTTAGGATGGGGGTE